MCVLCVANVCLKAPICGSCHCLSSCSVSPLRDGYNCNWSVVTCMSGEPTASQAVVEHVEESDDVSMGNDRVTANVDGSVPAHEVVSSDCHEDVNFTVERPRRDRSRPKWMLSGDYVVD